MMMTRAEKSLTEYGEEALSYQSKTRQWGRGRIHRQRLV